MISPTMQLVSENIPGFSSRGFPCSGASGRTVAISFRSSQRFKFGSTSRVSDDTSSYVCRASSSGKGRNSDYSSQGKRSFSRNRNKKNEDREGGFDSFEQSDILSSKNGSLLSYSNSAKNQPTATPGPREKEIVALFRKVQAKLRERAANKDEKKFEVSQSQAKESETVDSLLKLLRKHSVEQSKTNSSTSSNNNPVMDQQEQNGSFNGGKSASAYNANNTTRDEEALDTNISSFSRPASNFRRRSPISRVKSQPIHSNKTQFNSASHESSVDMGKQNEQLPGKELGDELEFNLDLDSETEAEPMLSVAGEFDEMLDESDAADDGEVTDSLGQEDLSSLKLSDLREIAKSRGLKGYSKMKKGDLLEFLSGSSI